MTTKIYDVINDTIKDLELNKHTMAYKGFNAKIRQSVQKPHSQKMFIWGFLGDRVPRHYLSYTGEQTDYERVVITVLEVYATMSTGTKPARPVYDDESQYKKTMGQTLQTMRTDKVKKTLDTRFNKMIATKQYDGIVYNLLHILKIVNQTDDTVYINYGQLAQDLLSISKGKSEDVKIKWARAYYRQNKTNTEKGEN